MTTHEKRLQLAIRNHTINVLRECATQTHTDWEKYVKKSEAKAMKEFLDLINQACKEAAIEELEKLEEDYNIVFVADGYGGHQREEVVLIDKLQARIKALKEGKQ